MGHYAIQNYFNYLGYIDVKEIGR